MQILILAAGLGSRLGLLTHKNPKALIKINSKEIGLRLLDSLKPYKYPVTLVGGYNFEHLKNKFKDHILVKDIIENSNYQKGSILTLLCAHKKMSDSFLIMNADHLYSQTILEKVMCSSFSKITVIIDKDRKLTDDDMKFLLKKDGTILEMDKKLSQFDGGYIGMTFVPQSKNEIYWQAAFKTLEEKGESVSVESVINTLASQNEPVLICDVSGSTWIEVDTPDDLKIAESKINDL